MTGRFREEQSTHANNAATKPDSTVRIVACAQRGDQEAFAVLFNRHNGWVRWLCLRMTGDWSEAEDLAQDAFLQLFRRISSFRGDSTFSTWFHRLVVNVVLMHFRRKRFRREGFQNLLTDERQATNWEYGEATARMIASAERIDIGRAVAQLPTGYRTVFLLHDV